MPPGRPPPRTHPQDPPRQGPRPLALHLLTHASILASSLNALPWWKSGLLPWRPSLSLQAQSLHAELQANGPQSWDKFQAALVAESLRRHRAVLDGVKAYQGHPHRRAMPAMPVLWQEGTTRLLDYRQGETGGRRPVLVVPSLINRAYVLDLAPRRSLVRALAGKGLAPFLVDWDQPGPVEQSFGLTDYVAGRLDRALDRVIAETGQKPMLLGYCMGGNLALALALRRTGDVAGLAVMATPWDFHAGREAHAMVMAALDQSLKALIDETGFLPVDILQSLFASLDPQATPRKFQAFCDLPRQSAKTRLFVDVEDWANDGVPLAGPVARECIGGWYGANDPMQGRWRIDGQVVDPRCLRLPFLALIPERDRIVPALSARPLVDLVPGGTGLSIQGGHVLMLLGRRAVGEVYSPLAKWLVRSGLR